MTENKPEPKTVRLLLKMTETQKKKLVALKQMGTLGPSMNEVIRRLIEKEKTDG